MAHLPKPHLPDAINPVHRLRVVGRFVRRQVKRAGAAPGTLVHTGPRKMEQSRIRVIDYDASHLDELELRDLSGIEAFRDSQSVSWINVDGLHDVALVEELGERFDIHPLVLEDLVHVGQRPKMEEYDGYLFVVLSMISWDEAHERVEEEQLGLVVGPRWILSFQERVGDVFEPVRERIRAERPRIRSGGAGYLAYALMDAVVDSYFGVLEKIGDVTEALELRVMGEPEPELMERLHVLKRELLVLRRALWPVRDLTNGLVRSESPLVTDATRVFLRDVHDHATRAIDTVETLRDVASGMIDLYLSNVGHRQNEIMKVLTVMASIFIPLTFLAGIYGMNFSHMPELAVPWAYPTLLGVMLVVGLGMVLFFKRKGWL